MTIDRQPVISTPKRRGFTLMELVVSMAIATVVLGGIASAVVVAGHALPNRIDVADVTAASADALNAMAAELACAQAFSLRSVRAIEFTVPDRSGDAIAETIRYEWSGLAGTALTRAYNGGAAVNVIDAVTDFTLAYNLDIVVEQPDPITNETAEFILSSHDPAVAPADAALTSTNLIGQYFVPTLPQGTAEWKVTRVAIRARVHGANKGITNVELRLPTIVNLPVVGVLDSALMYESTLPAAYAWTEFSFSGAIGLLPSQGLCLTLTMNKRDADLADVEYDSAGGAGLLTTSDGGLIWTASAGSMSYIVYGTATTVTLPDAITRQWLVSVGLSLQTAAGDTPVLVRTAATILNRPEVTP